MTMDYRSFSELQPSLQLRIDLACASFEKQCREGGRPSIQEVLATQSCIDERFPLFRELLRIEREWRTARGETPRPDDYSSDFPEYAEAIATEFAAPRSEPSASLMDTKTFAPLDSTAERRTEGRRSAAETTRDVSDIGAYELLEEIGRGGMGIVYRARHRALDRPAAVKLIREAHHVDSEQVRRFVQEAETIAKLEHPNIVPLYEVGTSSRGPFLAMAFMEGGSLAARIKDSPLPPREAASLMRQVAEAVAHAHERGVLHRDLKPGNILLDSQGCPRVTDFGLAKQLDGEREFTATGEVLGTPGYMPPEQALGDTKRIGPAADVYSLGATLYCLLFGRPPFQAATPLETIRQVIESDPVPLRRLNSSIPVDLETICAKCLEKEPTSRYATARETAEELGRFLRDEPILARPANAAERLVRWCRRNKTYASLLSVASLLLLTLSIGGPIVASREMHYRREVEAGSEKLAEKTKLLAQESLNLAAEVKRAKQATEASQRTARTADARRLATESNASRTEYPQRGVLLALEAIDATERYGESADPLAVQALQDAMGTIGGVPLPIQADQVQRVAFSPDGLHLAVAVQSAHIRVFALGPDSSIRQVRELKRHQDTTRELIYSPNGSKLVWMGDSGKMEVWDLAESQAQIEPESQTELALRPPAVKISPDSRWLAIAGYKPAVTLHPLAESNPFADVVALESSNPDVMTRVFTFSQDGRKIFAANVNREIMYWEVDSEGLASSPRTIGVGNKLHPSHLAVSHSGRFLASGEYKLGHTDLIPEIRIWDLEAKESAKTPSVIKGVGGPFFVFQFISEDRRLVVGNAQDLRIFDLHDDKAPTLRHVLSARNGRINAAQLSKDERMLVAGGEDHSLHVWNLQTDNPSSTLRTFRGHDAAILSIELSPEGRRIASLDQQGHARFWSIDEEVTAAGKVLRGHGDEVLVLSLNAGGTTLYSKSMDSTLRQWNLLSSNPTTTARVFHDFSLFGGNQRMFGGIWFSHKGHLAVSPDGEWLASSGISTARAWKSTASRPEVESQFLPAAFCQCMTYSPDGRYLIAGGGMASQQGDGSGKVQIYDLVNFNERQLNPRLTVRDVNNLSGPLLALAARPLGDDEFRIISAAGKEIAVCDVKKGVPSDQPRLLRLEDTTKYLAYLAVDERGEVVATAGMEPKIHVWRVSESNLESPTHVFSEGDKPVSALAISPDGRRLAAGFNNQIFVWNLSLKSPGAAPMILRGHGVAVSELAFSLDSRYLASTEGWIMNEQGGDYAIRLWDLSSNDPDSGERVLSGHTGKLRDMRFSPDDRTLITAGVDATIRLWNLDFERFRDFSRLFVGRELTDEERLRFGIANRIENRTSEVDFEWLPPWQRPLFQAPTIVDPPAPPQLRPFVTGVRPVVQPAPLPTPALPENATREEKIRLFESRIDPHKFNFGIHNELRHLYGGIDLKKSHLHCDIIFRNLPSQDYTLRCLGAYEAKKEDAVAKLLDAAEKYPEFLALAAACKLRAAELLSDDAAEKKRELLDAVLELGTNDEALKPYHAKARRLLETLAEP